jgi:pilus assembly protein Flp/PilA
LKSEITMQRIAKFLKNEDGLAVTEYGLLLALIAVAVVTVVREFGTKLALLFTNATTALPDAAP